MSVLDAITPPATWAVHPLVRVAPRVQQSGRPDLISLSVFLDDGVVPRASREDNFNRLGEDLAKYLVVEPGDVVFNKLRTWQGGFGVSRYEGIVSPAYFVCRPGGDSEPRYLHYLLRSTVYLQELTRVSKWMPPSQFDIAWEQLRLLPVLTPPLVDQVAIADYLDAETARIDALIAKKKRMEDLLGEARVSVMLDGVGGALTAESRVPAGLPWIRERGESWGTTKLTYVARLGSGHTPSRDHPEWWTNPSIPWITTGEVAQMRADRIEFITETREMISEVGVANSAAEVHPAGTVVLCRTAASAGYSAIMGHAMATSQDFATWTCGPLIRPRFLLLCLRVMRQDLLGRLAMGSTHKTIYMPDIESLRVPLPSPDEQDDIVEAVWRRLQMVDACVDALHRQIGLLMEHRQAVITAAVTGVLDVTGVSE